MPEGNLDNQYTRSVDIFAYGLLMLELLSGKRIDGNKDRGWEVRSCHPAAAAALVL
jgi:WNK lysine deficient protein kinase